MTLRLLTAFERVFAGHPYHHRRSTQGDAIAAELFEDLYALGRSASFVRAVDARERGFGPTNRPLSAKRSRRGDGTFGLLVRPERAVGRPGHAVCRGAVATIDIGVEVKVLNKAMLKQIDRVIGDLEKQVKQWRRHSKGKDPVSVAVVGINHANYTISYEGTRQYRADGAPGGYGARPADEAPKAEARIRAEIVQREIYDETILLRFRATNDPPFSFAWVDSAATENEYVAALLRIARSYDERF